MRRVSGWSHLQHHLLYVTTIAHFIRFFAGISLKSQELYLIVYVARYLDLFTTFYSIYNLAMKLVYILTTAIIVCILRKSELWQTSYSPTHDSFQHWKYILFPCFAVAFVTYCALDPFEFNFMGMFWTFSIFLEAVAMVPQLVMFRSDRMLEGNQHGESRDLILLPIFLFGIYRGLYIINWIYRAHTEKGYRHHFVVYICGVIQVLLYSSFFKVYVIVIKSVCPQIFSAPTVLMLHCTPLLYTDGAKLRCVLRQKRN